MPYAILSSAVPHRKMGVYMGMFNLFVVIPQILAAAILGLLVRNRVSRSSHLRDCAGRRLDDFLRLPDDVCQRFKERKEFL